LGVSEAEFLTLTPRQFSARYNRWQKQQQRGDLYCGLLASVIATTAFGSEKSYTPHDFFPDLPKPKPKVMEGEEILGVLKDFQQRKKS
jgi:hypothetical protein